MKRLFFILVLLWLTAPLIAQAAPFQWLALDPLGSSMQIYGPDLKSNGFFKAGPRPFNLKSLPDKSGYALLYLGSKSMLGSLREPGGIIYLNNQLKPTGKKLPFSGLVVGEYYQPDLRRWLVFTADGKNGALNILDLQKGSLEKISLSSAPTIYKLKGQDKLAITTAGNVEANIRPELVLVDLTTQKTDVYPLSLNPGAIFFSGDDRLLIACGGYRDKGILNLNLTNAAESTSEPAILHLIDCRLKTVKKIPVGYAPLAIIQDNSKPDTFYFTSITKPNPSETSGLLQILSGATITAKVNIPAEPTYLAQASTGNLCILDRDQFFLVNPAEGKIISQFRHDLKNDEFLLSQDGKTGYLTNNNSNYLEIINLSNGTIQTKLKFSKGSLLGALRLGNLLPNSLPPVIGMPEKPAPIPENKSSNHRIFFAKEPGIMYALSNNSEVCVVDLNTFEVKKSISFRGIAYGIHSTPNSKYIVAATETYWHLIDPAKSKPVLSVLIARDEDKVAPPAGYYSPDGRLLIIPFEKRLSVIDTETGKFLGNIPTKVENPIIVWTH